MSGISQLPIYTQSFDGGAGTLKDQWLKGGFGWMVGLLRTQPHPERIGDGWQRRPDGQTLTNRIPDGDGIC